MVKKILLIDDDLEDCYLFSLLLKEINSELELNTCHECEQALAHIQNTMPDLIFLDIHFPKMNGYDCIRMIRDCRAFQNLPVVMYSSGVGANDITYSYGLGASLFFAKPNHPETLKASLKKILELDWNHSYNITSHHFNNGSYSPFSLDADRS
jgi:CheY-like chemotaxis protein